MAVGLLLRLTDKPRSADPDIDRASAYYRGDVVDVREDGRWFSRMECPPDFGFLIISDATAIQVRSYALGWERWIDFNVIAHDPVQDGYRIEVKTKAVSLDPAGRTAITREQCEAFLATWGYEGIVSTATNSVRFDILVWNAICSPGFWSADVLGIGFTKISYNPGTGGYAVAVDWSATGWRAQKIRERIEGRDGVVVGADLVLKTGTFTITRADVFRTFEEAARSAIEKTYARRQWHFPEAASVAVEAAGGRLTVTKAQAVGWLRNKMEE